MKKQKQKSTKTNFLFKFKSISLAAKAVIVGGVVALILTVILVPILVANKNGVSGKTAQYVQWHLAYKNYYAKPDKNKFEINGKEYNLQKSPYDHIKDEIDTTSNSHPGNKAFGMDSEEDVVLTQISKLGINKENILKNKNDDLVKMPFMRYLGFDFGTNKTYANVFYQLEWEGNIFPTLYHETIEIKGFALPKTDLKDSVIVTNGEFKNMVLPSDFIVPNDLSIVGYGAFQQATFAKDAKFSLANTQVTGVLKSAFENTKFPEKFTLNLVTSLIEEHAFHLANLNSGFKIPDVTKVAERAFEGAKLPDGHDWYDGNNAKQVLEEKTQPLGGWYVKSNVNV